MHLAAPLRSDDVAVARERLERLLGAHVGLLPQARNIAGPLALAGLDRRREYGVHVDVELGEFGGPRRSGATDAPLRRRVVAELRRASADDGRADGQGRRSRNFILGRLFR